MQELLQFEKLDEKVHEMVKKIEELRAKDLERGDQFLKLTEMMKVYLIVAVLYTFFCLFNFVAEKGQPISISR